MVESFNSFSDAIAHSSEQNNSNYILLGNGFSQSYSSKFGYRTLKEKASLSELSADKNDIFKRAGSDDFETVIRRLDEALSVIDLYEPDDVKLKKTIQKDIKVIKSGLVETLLEIHPDIPDRIDDQQYARTRKFLRNFKRIYTLNYDLLLYWSLMRNEVGDGRFKFQDGFGPNKNKLVWSRDNGIAAPPVYNLHGGMHFYVENKKLHKLKSRRGSSLLSQLMDNLHMGKYPFVVTEGTRDDKEERIARSAYLRNCHDTLTTLRGALFTHGVALSDNDDHVFDKIADSPKLKSIYVGIYGNDGNEIDAMEAKLKRISRRHNEIAGKDLDLFFYPSNTAGIW